MNLNFLLDLALNATQKACAAILAAKKNLEIWQKDDGSPLSSADLASNEILCAQLAQSGLAICSEEQPLAYEKRKDLDAFWLIDPLDGTKSFIKGSDEYCVLVALIAHKRPILAVIAKPSTNELYYAHKESVLYKNGKPLCVGNFEAHKNVALVSVHHPNEKNAEFLAKNALTPTKISSALKFIALLDGKAGVYHRFENLHSWDIAAGDFLLNQSGGFMGKFNAQALQNAANSKSKDDDFLSYNEQGFLCEHFIALSQAKFARQIII